MIVTLKSSSDRDRPSGDAVGFSISNFSLGCRLLDKKIRDKITLFIHGISISC